MPERILVTGDWHGNQPWAVNVLKRVPELLWDQDIKLLLHLGDFGIWPDRDGERYLAAIEWALGQVGRRRGQRPTWPATPPIANASSASWTRRGRGISCTATCTAPTGAPATSGTGQ